MTAFLSVPDVAARGRAVIDELERAVIGKRAILDLVLAGLIADGHVLLEDLPGVAKTLIARSFAQVTGLRFGRVQFTPDLMPADITGSSIFDQRSGDFRFVPGPVFTNLLLGDEINRASQTQAALLEAMQERQVTTDGVAHPLDPPFLVVATQNPIEYEGTYPLPEAQLDRFLLRLSVGYPDAEAEWTILSDRLHRKAALIELRPVLDAGEFVAMQRAVEEVYVAPIVGRYIVAVTAATRHHDGVEVGASPRESLAVMTTARARAALDGRDFVSPDDVKAVAGPALAHRLRLSPDRWVRGERPEAIVDACLERAVRSTNSLATAYLAHHDRVGLVSFGGSLRWLRPGMGLRQQYLLIDTLLATRPFASVARRDVRLIPPQALAPGALVVAITPLEDERMLDALTDLRNRGIDLVLIEVSPTPTTPVPFGRAGLVAYRLWELQRALTRDQLRDRGVPVVEWTRDRPITEVVEEVRAWPRSRRSAS